jgi:hypothetical protein
MTDTLNPIRGLTCTCKCRNCGNMFTARVVDRKRGWAKFCSKSCKAQRQEKQTGQFRGLLQRQRDDTPVFPSLGEEAVQGV